MEAVERRSTGWFLKWLLVMAFGVALTFASIAVLYVGMRDVMEVGGRCASGASPYVIAVPCPEGTWSMALAGFTGFFGAMIWALGCSVLRSPRLYLLAWPALFLALGYNFIDFGLNPPDGSDTAWGFLLCGVLFVAMGGIPLALAVLVPGTRRAVFGVPGPRAIASLGGAAQNLARVSRAFVRVDDGEEADRDQADLNGLDIADILEQAMNGTLRGSTTATNASSTHSGGSGDSTGSSLAADLQVLADLHERGMLSAEQFEAAKTARLAKEMSS